MKRVWKKLGPGLSRVFIIPARTPCPADVELAWKSNWHGKEVGVEHIQLGVGDRCANDDIFVLTNLPDARPDCRFRRPVHIPYSLAAREQLSGKLGRQSLPAAQNFGQRWL